MDETGRVVVVVRPGARSGTILEWLRRLLPAALLLLAPASIPDGANVITIDADEVISGPLSLADALTRLWSSLQDGTIRTG
jgi:hypothetical protein